jgi:hypothetical protein
MRTVLFLFLISCSMSCNTPTSNNTPTTKTDSSKISIPTAHEIDKVEQRLGNLADTTGMKRYIDSLYRANRLVLAAFGLPAVASATYDSLLTARYGIIVWRGACIPEPGMDLINEKMQPVIERRFGKDVFDRTYKEADSIFRMQYPQQDPSGH